MKNLYERLASYGEEDYYPMHMPGHKRNINMLTMGNPYSIDITEIEGFDNLHQAEGILKQLSERISRLYGAGRSFPLVNGSTAGILAGISAAVNRGDQVLIARNSHKSVYHAVTLLGLRPVYIYPEMVEDIPVNGGILTEKIEEMLITYPNIKLVVITSPTYEGVVSDITEIAKVVHLHGAFLLVDEAHGAHFGFHKCFPLSAVTKGADIIIQSLHKTLPSFTQTAVLHSNKQELNHRIEQYLSIYQSSSPSYLLMAGIDRCIALLEDRAEELFYEYNKKLTDFYRSMGNLSSLKVMDRKMIGKFGVYDLDSSKIIISMQGTEWTGHQLGKELRERYHIVMEMEAKDYVLGMTSICDTKEGFDRLGKALHEIDYEVPGRSSAEKIEETYRPPIQVMTPSEAMEQSSELIPFWEGNGRIAADFISLFPPGSPLLVPGERMDEDLLRYIDQARRIGLIVTGIRGDNKDEIEVIRS